MSALSGLYRALFGREKLADGDIISMAEHGRVADSPDGQAFKYMASVDPETGVTESSLISTLQELIQRLAPLAGAMAPTAQLRTIGVVSGSVTATGGGYITSAQSIAEKAASGILFPEKIAITNLTAIQSNIQNVSVS